MFTTNYAQTCLFVRSAKLNRKTEFKETYWVLGNAGPKPPSNSTPGNPAPATPQTQSTPPSQPAANAQPQTNGPAAAGQTNGNGNGGSNTGTWAQAAGKGLPPTSQATANTPTPTSASTKQQLEQLNNMREALFSQDGWGAVSIPFNKINKT